MRSAPTPSSDEDQGVGESKQADQALAEAFPDATGETVLVQSTNGVRTGDPEFRAAVNDAITAISREKGVQEVESPYKTDGAISEDGRSALISFEIKGDTDEAKDLVDPVLDSVAAVDKRYPELRVEQFGDASSDKAISQAFEDDFQKAEFTSLPITLIILVIAFGALVAAGNPAAAGDHRRRGHDRPARPDQPDLAGRGVDHLGDPADRPGGGGRLRAVLPAP